MQVFDVFTAGYPKLW